MLKTRPMTLTSVTGVSFCAVLRSNLGISTREVSRAAACKSTTAMTSWMKRKSRGSSGDEFSTALLLRNTEMSVEGIPRTIPLTRRPSSGWSMPAKGESTLVSHDVGRHDLRGELTTSAAHM